jgi:RecB family exonuclease
LVHAALAECCDPTNPRRPRTLEEVMEVGRRHWRDDIARYRPQAEEARREFFSMLEAWWQAEGSQGDLAPEVLATEHRFGIEVGGHRLTGAIDRVDRADGDDGIRLVDYKTGARPPAAEAVADDLQLAVYHLAAVTDPSLASLGPPTQLRLIHVRTMRAFEQPVADDHAARTEARVGAVAVRILAEEFAPSVDANCRTCAAGRLCALQPEGREVGSG